MSTGYAHRNLDEIEDIAPKFGMDTMGEARFARTDLGAERIGLSHYRVKPGSRVGFGHRHKSMEEVYVVVGGGGRFKLDDDIVDVGPRDVVYCAPQTWREWEAGPDGLELLAFGSHVEGDDESEMQPGWWSG
jgi:mannose-6-phosphate isomerase-like protein (cupin superfamily)